MKFSLDEILTVIDKVKDTNLASFAYEDTDTKIKIKGYYPASAGLEGPASRGATEAVQSPVQTVTANGPLMAAGTTAVPTAESRTAAGYVPAAEYPDAVPAAPTEGNRTVPAVEMVEEKAYVIIESPMVGTFYAAPSEDGEPFVRVGDVIQKGQPVGIVEAMKLMNEIEAEVEGVVEEILVTNGQLVEFGQPLMKISAKQ